MPATRPAITDPHVSRSPFDLHPLRSATLADLDRVRFENAIPEDRSGS
jgi:hypothetical protein